MTAPLSLLIATDNHLGYAEKDPIRGNDSFDTFEEILRLAQEHQVDGVLLGGDLFHENKPSRKCMHRAMELFRRYCLGSRVTEVQLLSDPTVNFASPFGTMNMEDPNYNVSMPVFVIHGNHDDPSGDGNLSAIDLLSTAGLVNYFGKSQSVDDITINPVLLQKGPHRMALYGLGAVRDERLHRTFLQRKVRLMRPEGDWFNMMILHQNRVPHGPTNHIPETFLDDFLHLVVWGHEHECQACDPTVCQQRGFVVCQPGSSVATSLSDGETRSKHVVILRVSGTEFELDPIPLKSVRPFMMHEVALKDAIPALELHDTKGIDRYLQTVVDRLIGRAAEEWKQTEVEVPLPLIRLKCDYSGSNPDDVYSIMNPQRFGQAYVGKVANPRDLVHFVRKRKPVANKTTVDSNPIVLVPAESSTVRVEDLVSQYLAHQQLDLLPQNEFTDMVRLAVEKDDRDAIQGFVKGSLDRMVEMSKNLPSLEDVQREFERMRRQREDEWDQLHQFNRVESPDPKPVAITRGRGRGRGRSSASQRGKRVVVYDEEEDEVSEEKEEQEEEAENFEVESPKRARTTRATAPKKTPTTVAAKRWPSSRK